MVHSHDMDFDRDPESRKATVSRLHVPGARTAPASRAASRPAPPMPWENAAAQTRFWSRTLAIIFLCCFVVGWPVGMSLSAWQRTGVFTVDFGITFPLLAIVGALTALIVIVGQLQRSIGNLFDSLLFLRLEKSHGYIPLCTVSPSRHPVPHPITASRFDQRQTDRR